MGISTIGTPSASALDLGLTLRDQTAAEVEAVRKKRMKQAQDANKAGATGMPNDAYMSLTGNQF